MTCLFSHFTHLTSSSPSLPLSISVMEGDFGECLGRLMRFPLLSWDPSPSTASMGLSGILDWAKRLRDQPTKEMGHGLRMDHALLEGREAAWSEKEKRREIEDEETEARLLSHAGMQGDGKRIGPLHLSPALVKAGVAVGRSFAEIKVST